MNAYWKCGSILVCTIAIFFSGWHVHAWKVGAELAAEKQALLEERVAQEKALARIAAEADKKLSTDRAKQNEIQKKVEVQIAKNPIGYGCKLPVDGVRIYREALATTTSAR